MQRCRRLSGEAYPDGFDAGVWRSHRLRASRVVERVKKTSSALLTMPAARKRRAETTAMPPQPSRRGAYRFLSLRRWKRMRSRSMTISSTQAPVAAATWISAQRGNRSGR